VRRERGLKPLPDGRWQFSWMFEGKYHRRIARTKTEARACLEKIRTQIREGRYLERPKKEVKTRFEDALEKFLAWGDVNVTPATRSSDGYMVERWKKSPAFAGKTLDKITPVDIEAFKAERLKDLIKKGPGEEEGRTVTKRTVDMDLGRLKRAFNLCIQWGLCENNPVAKVKFFHEDAKRMRYLTEEEEKALMKAASPDLQKIITFALHTGMRRGEITGLRWQDIDFRNGVAVIPAPHSKNRKDRPVPLNKVALKILRSFARPIDSSALVFGNSKGKIETNIARLWRRAIVASGIEDFRFHDLRHTFASRLVMAGEDLAVLRELLGHSTFQMTLRYAHLAPSRLKEAVAVLESNLRLTCNRENTPSADSAPAKR